MDEELIQKLVDQCVDKRERHGTTVEVLQSRKFAELIVRECAGVADHSNVTGKSIIGQRIKQHFGVEEQEKVAPEPKCSVCGTTENVKYMGGFQPYLCDSIDCIPF